MANILIVDDQKVLRKNLAFYLKSQGYDVDTAESGEEALTKITSTYFDVVISDYKMGEMSGYDLMKEAKRLHPSTGFMIMTAFGSVPLAVDIMRDGAADFLQKPFDYSTILDKIEKTLKRRETCVASDNEKYDQVIAQSQKMKDIIDLATKASASDVPIFIEGESGTGKELLARMIHQQGRRSRARFVAVECSSDLEASLEKEIFGSADNPSDGGAISRANGGTLFLRDIDGLSPRLQIRILRFIREGAFSPADSANVLKSDVRIIASSIVSLKRLITNGSFREDLYYQLNVMSIYVPPLKARAADIFPLVEYFLAKYSSQNNKNIKAVSPEVLAWMRTYEWAGNVRELENIIARGCTLANGEILDESLIFTLPEDRPESEDSQGFFNMTLKDNQRTLILKALKQNNGNYSRTASQLGISRTTLWRRLKRFQIDGVPAK